MPEWASVISCIYSASTVQGCCWAKCVRESSSSSRMRGTREKSGTQLGRGMRERAGVRVPSRSRRQEMKSTLLYFPLLLLYFTLLSSTLLYEVWSLRRREVGGWDSTEGEARGVTTSDWEATSKEVFGASSLPSVDSGGCMAALTCGGWRDAE